MINFQSEPNPVPNRQALAKGLGVRLVALLVAIGLLSGCVAGPTNDGPNYAVTVIAPTVTITAPLAQIAESSPTFDWGEVTLVPLKTPQPEQSASPEAEPADQATTAVEQSQFVADPFTEKHKGLLVASNAPVSVNNAQITLGRFLLPVDLSSVEGPYRIESVEVNNYPGWRFLSFDLPIPTGTELGMVIRAPFGGEVMAGTMQMINDRTVHTVSVDHPLDEQQLVRTTFVYSGTVEVFFVMGQQVQTGESLFRLTRDTGRLNMLGNTPLPLVEGATFTLHTSIDTITRQESGTESLKFVRGVSLVPDGFLKNEDGLIISPSNN